jgi:hypothetical protein
MITQDEHHTMDELYEHRHALFCALMRSNWRISWYGLKHSDGTMYDGWFIAGMNLPTGTISYHMPISQLHHVENTWIKRLENAPEWDGYTPDDVVERLNWWRP